MKKALWVRLRKYRFENLVPVSFSDRIRGTFGSTDAFTRAFAAKVAKKHGWSNEFAFLAIREYKKFVYLGVTSHYEVTPSAIIDKVWHEHQLFTKGYREFCEKVLERHFDHSPELIPDNTQNEVFSAQYLKTLSYYEREFGCVPPPEIWGKPKFNPTTIQGMVKKPEKKSTDASSSTSDSDIPLFLMFTSGPDSGYAPVPVIISGQSAESGSGDGGSSRSESSTSGSSDTSTTSSCSSSSSSCSSSCSSGS